MRDKKELIKRLIQKWLPDAPSHLIRSQVSELEKLSYLAIAGLMVVNPNKVSDSLPDHDIVSRLKV